MTELLKTELIYWSKSSKRNDKREASGTAPGAWWKVDIGIRKIIEQFDEAEKAHQAESAVKEQQLDPGLLKYKNLGKLPRNKLFRNTKAEVKRWWW